VCKPCGTRYTPPTLAWAAVLFILIGLPLAAFGAYAVVTRLVSGNLLGLPAMAGEGNLGFLGLSAIVQGARTLVRSG